jgi:chromosome segregation ATPase
MSPGSSPVEPPVNSQKNDNSIIDLANAESKLLKFDEDNKVVPGKDINTKITALDTNLVQLRNELSSINVSVEEGLDRLGDSETDLTAKVSETYKRLGEIDNSYKSLLQISSRIDGDIKKLNGDVSTVAEQAASGIKTLEQSTVVQSTEFTHQSKQIVSRVDHLAEASKMTGALLSQKIQTTTEKMLKFETQIISEIERLSSLTKDKTKAIEVSVNESKAKILKLQSVDEAIIKRATTLEISSAELSVKSQDMQVSADELRSSTKKLSYELDALSARTQVLETQLKSHGSLIMGLQKAGSELSDKLSLLALRENKHFNIFSASFLLLLVATAVIYFSQKSQFDMNDVKFAEQVEVTEKKIMSLQQTQTGISTTANRSLAVLQDEMDKSIARVDEKLQTMQDQVQSVEGRFNNSSAFSRIGDDNIIHGAQWISGLQKSHYTVQLAYVDNREVMYELAERYNHQLKDSLSYFEVSDAENTKYVLLSGDYATATEAEAVANAMPAYNNMQRPVTRSLNKIQVYIANR